MRKLDLSRMFKQAPNTQKTKRDKHTPEQKERERELKQKKSNHLVSHLYFFVC
jgi:hypothetical protein